MQILRSVRPRGRRCLRSAVSAGAALGAMILVVSGCRPADDAAAQAGSPPPGPPAAAGQASAPQVSPEIQAKIDAYRKADVAARAAHMHAVDTSAGRRAGQ